jgi:hypothetical protein
MRYLRLDERLQLRSRNMAMRRSFEEIEAVSRRLRLALGIDGLDSPDLIDVFEKKLSQVFKGFSLKRVLDAELPYAEASADCSTNTVTVRESVYQDALRGDGRARMTLAHELGHIALGTLKSAIVRKSHTVTDLNKM